MEKELIKFLGNNRDEKYRIFSAKLLPKSTKLLGVRLPILKKKAQEILNRGRYEEVLRIKCRYYEEKMLKGFVIGGILLPFKKRVQL